LLDIHAELSSYVFHARRGDRSIPIQQFPLRANIAEALSFA